MKMNKIFATIAIAMMAIVAYGQETVGYMAERDYDLQSKIQAAPGDYPFKSGDTIVINKEVVRYLTGEEPSNWVYYVRHTILQVGGKRFPDGILVNGIMSWIGKEGAYLTGTPEMTAEAAKKIAADKAAVKKVEEEVANLPQETVAEIQSKAAAVGATVVEPAPVEPAPVDTVAETPAEVAPVEETPVEEATEEVAENDSTKEKHFNHRFTIGARGGAASLMHEAPSFGNWKTGFDVMLDLQYAFYSITEKQNMYGFLVGASAGYARSGLGNAFKDQYTVSTEDGKVDYTVEASNANEQDGEVVLEIPIMFSMVMNNGLFLNFGPRLSLPVYAHYNQKLTDPNVTAYFPEMGVTVRNEAITGKVEDNQLNTKGKWQASTLNVMLSAEIGYEWNFKNGNSLGLGAFANYGLYTLRKSTEGTTSLIQVTAPSATKPAESTIYSATDSYAKGVGFFDAGVKLAYHFNFFKNKK